MSWISKYRNAELALHEIEKFALKKLPEKY